MPNKKINALDVRVAVSTDLMLVGDPATGTAYKSTLATLPLVPTSRTLTINGVTFDLSANRAWTIASGVTSVGLSMPSAFSVASSPITSSGTLAVTATGTTVQYIDGTGALQTFPTILQSSDLIAEVRNQSGATMTKGTIVYISGATGNKPLISKALATGDATSAQTFGLLQADIANNAVGYIVIIGSISNLDTSALTEGQQLYLSGTTAGTWTTTKPYAPIHLVYVGIVIRSHPTLGVLSVKIQNGYEMDELHNVSAQTPSNNDGIFYNSTNSLWENKSIATALGYTPVTSARTISTTSPLVGGGDLSANRTLSIPAATTSVNGYLTSADWTTFNAKQAALTITTTGTSGAATLVGATLNIPQYSGGGGTNIYTSDGTLTANRSLTHGGFNLSFIGGTFTNRFTSAGRLLLGTTSDPGYQLFTNSGGVAGYFQGGTGGYAAIAFSADNNATIGALTTYANQIIIGRANNTFGNQFGAQFDILIQSNGDVQIGTDTQRAYKLHVKGNANVTSLNIALTTAQLSFSSVSGLALVGATGSSFNIGLLETTGNKGLFVDANGFIKIGVYTDTFNSSAILDIVSTTRGFLPPRMTNAQRAAISSPAVGLIVYCTNATEGLYVYKSTGWTFVI